MVAEAAAVVAAAAGVAEVAAQEVVVVGLVALNLKEALVAVVLQDGVLAVVRLVILSSNGQPCHRTEHLQQGLWVEEVLLILELMEDMGLDHPALEVPTLLETPHTATGLQVNIFSYILVLEACSLNLVLNFLLKKTNIFYFSLVPRINLY